MDDGGHRENGRHKTDQYKSAQSQVLKANLHDASFIMNWLYYRKKKIGLCKIGASTQSSALRCSG